VRVPAAKFTTAEIAVPVSGVAIKVKLEIEAPFSTVPEYRIVAYPLVLSVALVPPTDRDVIVGAPGATALIVNVLVTEEAAP
jgi:hypothetical protein